MLRVFGSKTAACDGIMRREVLKVGAISLLGPFSLPRLLRAEKQKPLRGSAPAKSVVLLNLFGGPPHMDMFDLKPDAPDGVRGELKPISSGPSA